jgi:hypothetical protein
VEYDCLGVSAIYAGLSVCGIVGSQHVLSVSHCMVARLQFGCEVLILWYHRPASRVGQPLAHTLLYHTVGYV